MENLTNGNSLEISAHPIINLSILKVFVLCLQIDCENIRKLGKITGFLGKKLVEIMNYP